MHPESGSIVLPDANSIRERLEHVSTDRPFLNEIAPRIMQLSGAAVAPEELVDFLERELSEYAQKRMLGITALALEGMPQILCGLVGEDQRDSVLEIWEERKAEKLKQDGIKEAELRRAQRGYEQPKFPRRRKKEIKKGLEEREALQRGVVKIDPKRIPRNPSK